MGVSLTQRVPASAKLDHILACATRVFYEKGYEGASIRDIARLSRVSLAGLYYYVESKEELLYLIQKHAFTTLQARLEEQLRGLRDPEARLRALIQNHLAYFLQNPEAMKVLSHEAGSLGPPYNRTVADLKRSYYRLCRGILDDLKRRRRLKGLDTRVAMLSLFGMMNWIYTWYDPKKDPAAEGLADHMSRLFFLGVLSSAADRRSRDGHP